MLSAAKDESVPLLAASWLSENSRPGFGGCDSELRRVIELANVLNASGLATSLYDDRIGSRDTGKERDSESGLDYFGARYYGSALGRFTSPDEFVGGAYGVFGSRATDPGPLPYADITNPQSLDKYAYALNNPFRYIDPDGHDALVVAMALEGAEIGSVCGPWCAAGGAIIGAGVGIYASYEAGKAIGNAISREQQRDGQGRFLPVQPGDSKPGSEQEKAGLDAVDATKNTGKLTYVDPKTGEKTATIPDGTTSGGQYVEVKAGKDVSETQQLGAMAAAAKDATGKPLIVVVDPSARVSKPVLANPNIEVVRKPLNQ